MTLSISRWLIALAALASSGGASALSLGELHVRSAVGHPFEAVLPYVAAAGESVAPQCIRSRDDAAGANQAVPYLANAQFAVNTRPGGGEIVVRTRAAVGEPAVRLRITIDCAPATLLSREFVVLLEAPAPVADREAVVPPVAAAPAAAPAPVEPRRPRRAERRERAAGQEQATREGVPGDGAGRAALGPSLRVNPGAAEANGAATRSSRAKPRAGGFRLTLSRPEDDLVLQRVLSLKRSEDLQSLTMPAREFSEAEREGLRVQARMALADNPVAEAIQMQSRLAALESNMGALRKQVAEVEAARAAAEEKARRLSEENKRLAARLDTFGMIAVLLACIALAAVGFWRYRVAAERRAQLQLDWDSAAEPAPVAAPSVQEQTPQDAEPEPSNPEPQAQYARTVVLDRTGSHQPTASALPSSLAQPLAPVSPPRPAAPVSTPSGNANAGPAPTVSEAPKVPTGAFAPLELPPAPPSAPAAPRVSDMPVPADDGMFLPESALKKKGAEGEVAVPPPAASTLIEKAFSIEPGAPDVNAALRPTTGRGRTLPGAGPTPPAQPDPFALALPPITGRGRTLQGAGVVGAVSANAPAAVAKTGSPIEFALQSPDHANLDAVSDQEARARVEKYLGEFERKLFPEIALGRVKLDEPRSIIGLARTYYQEDFDPAKAISFLEYALHRSTDPMLIHLALLEVLRMERRVREYASVARAFRGQYPDSGTYWQLVAAYGRLLDPSDPAFAGERVPGLDLDTPSNWLGNTIDMTKYVLGQKVADSVRDLPEPVARGGT